MLKAKYKKALERMARTGLTRVIVEAEDRAAEGGVAYEVDDSGPRRARIQRHEWTAWGGGSDRWADLEATKHLRGLLEEVDPLEMSDAQLRLAHALGVDWRSSVGSIGTRAGCRDGLAVEDLVDGGLQLVEYRPGRAPDGTPSGYRARTIRKIERR